MLYDSGIKAKTVIDDVTAETDISQSIATSSYLRWLNEFEQGLYKTLINSTCRISITVESGSANLPLGVNAEQVKGVFKGEEELNKVDGNTLALLDGYPVYSLESNAVKTGYGDGDDYVLVYRELPVIKTASNYNTEGAGNVCVPFQFLECVYSKLRGEAYKLANEDALAAKWLTDYNTILNDIVNYYNANKKAEV